MSNLSSLFSDNENDSFFFESDHLALRGNKDYCEVLKTIVTLSAQREKLIKDYKKVAEIRKIVLENPQVILEKIQNKEDLGFNLPERIDLPKLPIINFDKYGVTVPQSVLKEIYTDSVNDIKIEEDPKKEKNDQRKWTVEEQKRLEELLLLYPPEPIERKRYQKIAKALGNRTLAQVTSRVQKYFLKLYKAGLPIPGRMPKSVKNNNRSDHLALRGNKDYCEVLKTIVTLSAQREKLIKDYKKVAEIRKIVLENPQVILEKIQNKEDLGFNLPERIDLPKLPIINFDKYGVTVPQSVLKEIYTDSVNDIKIEEDPKKEKNDQRKWTVEEQKRLEELLLLYPPEPIERKRYQKIAKALGNRTLAQVTSRVQKYFLKLYKAGLPIPGRMPKSVKNNNRKSAMHKHQRFNHYLWKPTTFFPEFSIPVMMDDSENAPGPSSCAPPPPASNYSNYLLNTDYHQPRAPEQDPKNVREMKIQLLQRVKEEKAREEEATTAPFHHIGYRCAHCNEWPIVGARWHCYTCPGFKHFCTDCVVSSTVLYNTHPISHPLLKYITDDESVAGVPQSNTDWYPKPVSETNLESDSSDSVSKNNSDSDSSDSEEMGYGGDSNLEAVVKAEPGVSDDSSGRATKNNSESDSRVGEEMENRDNSVTWSDDEDIMVV